MGEENKTPAKVLSGTALAKEIRQELKIEVDEMKKKYNGQKPGLAIVQVGDRSDSTTYIKMKLKAASEIGIESTLFHLERSSTQHQILSLLKKLNEDFSIHGIIVQMPLDCENKVDSHLVTDSVSPHKDVDGLHTINEGKVAVGDFSGFIPCTPNGVLKLIKKSQIDISGKQAVVIGRSKILGTPVSELLKWHDATVTTCHSRTKDLEKITAQADILVVAIGKPEFVRGSWVKPGAVVIDCGINSIEDKSKPSGTRLVGDVNYEEVSKVAGYITPVPGGVGPMTVAMLMKNTVSSAQLAMKKLFSNSWNLSILPLKIESPPPSDIKIAKSQIPKDISVLANEIGLYPSEISLYGNTKAKVKLSVMKRLSHINNGKYVVITGITPTSLGEGKSTTTYGLAQALAGHKHRNAIACVRQPSQGPLFGIKGGAAGGGYSQVIPMEEFNLHLTGDIHAVTAANNLLAAQIDTRAYHEHTQNNETLYMRLVQKKNKVLEFSDSQLRRLKRLGIEKTDPTKLTEEEIYAFSRLNIDRSTIVWNRVIDTHDRYLREVEIGKSRTEKNYSRMAKFDSTVASEIMAILALSKDMADLKERISRIVVAQSTKGGVDITADDLGVTGALTILLKDAIEPTLMQTLEGTPVMVHAGPFANIAHGCSSIIADLISLKLVGENGFVVTEAGFGSDIGMEKFFNIKCRTSGCVPNAAVIVATVRALKMHGEEAAAGEPLESNYIKEDVELVRKGCCNLRKHIENAALHGVHVIVAVNAMKTDTEAEWAVIKEECAKSAVTDVVICSHWEKGGAGAVELAESVIKACETPNNFRFLYDLDQPLADKIRTIASKMYGAVGVEFSTNAMEKLIKCQEKGYANMPICMAKTALSLSGDPSIKGVPKNYSLPIQDVYFATGAGFLVVIAGEISKMPGLPTRPCMFDVDFDTETAEIKGLF